MVARLIAHISDLHLLAVASDGSGARADVRTRLVSIGRPLDVSARTERARRALAAAFASGADHLVLSGDLTEMGHADEMELAAELLSESGFAADRITIVPGNHDRYAHHHAWRDALSGPLAPFTASSAGEPGKVVDLGSIRLLPFDVTIRQSVALATGLLSDEAARTLDSRLRGFGSKPTPVALVQHHPPYDRGPVWRWLDGLSGWEKQRDVLARHENVQVLHGHVHEDADRPMHGRAQRILGAPAVVEDGDVPRVRLYDVGPDGLVPRRTSLAHAA